MAITNEDVAKVLDDALALMNDSGAHWTQGTYASVNEAGEPTYCSVGAVYTTTGTDPYYPPSGQEQFVLTQAALLALATAYTPIDMPGHARSRVIKWNDASRTKWEDVVKRFRTASAKLRKEK